MWLVRPISALAAVLALALGVAACGGDDSPEQPIVIPTETTSSLSKDDFIQEADAICQEANSAIAEFAANGQGLTAAGEIADIRQGVADDMTDLGPPDDDQQTADEVIAGYEAQAEAGQKIALAVERESDTTEFETELQNAKDETLQAAEAYGFEECGQEPSGTGTSTTGATGVAPSTGGTSVTPAPVSPAPAPSGGSTGDTGGTGGGVSPGGGGVSP